MEREICIHAAAEASSSPQRGRLRRLAIGAVSIAFGTLVLLAAISASSRTSEDFRDTHTGTMSFGGSGDKTIEIAGALGAVTVGVLVWYVLTTRPRLRRDPAAPKHMGAEAEALPLPAPTAELLLIPLMVLGASCLSLAALTVAGTFGLIPTRGVVPLVSASTVALACAAAYRSQGPRELGLRRALVTAQLFVAGGAFGLIPPPVLTSDGHDVLVRNWARPIGWAVVLGVATVVLWSAVSRFRRLSGEPTAVRLASPPLVGPAVVVGATFLSAAVGVPRVSADNYHFGELVTPEFLLTSFDQLPFSDQLPARGILVNYAPAWISRILADDWAGLVPIGSAVLVLAVLSVTFMVLKGLVGTAWAAALTVIAGFAAADRMAVNDLVMVVLVMLVARASRTRSMALTTLLFAASAAVALLLAPGQGLGFVFAGLVVIAAVAIQRPPRRRDLFCAAAVASIACSAIVALPAREMLKAAVGYVLSQGSVNDQVWGVPWVFSLNGGMSLRAFLDPIWELSRASALIGLGAMVIIALSTMRRDRGELSLPLWVGLGAYTALQLPRALGRIDPGSLSRIGLLSVVVMGTIIPVVILTQSGRRSILAVVGCLALVGGLIAGELVRPGPSTGLTQGSLSALRDRMIGLPRDPGLTPVMAGPGVQALSRAVVPSGLLEGYTALQRQYQALLPAGSPRQLLSVTNSQTDFRYLAADNALDVAAPFNITSEGTELDNIRRLEERQPAVILLLHSWSANLDGGGLGLRTPVLFEWIQDSYTPLECGSPGAVSHSIWAVREPTEAPGCIIGQSPTAKTSLFAQAVGATPDLAWLPASWAAGRSRVPEVLTASESVTAAFAAVGNAMHIEVPVPERMPRSGILEIDVDCGGWRLGTITWGATPTSPQGSATSQLGGGRALIPVGAYPSLARGTGSRTLTIKIPNARACQHSSEVSWYSRDRVTSAQDLGLLKK